MIDEVTKKALDDNYAKWKISPGGVVVALTHPWSYTNTRIHVNCDRYGYSHAF